MDCHNDRRALIGPNVLQSLVSQIFQIRFPLEFVDQFISFRKYHFPLTCRCVDWVTIELDAFECLVRHGLEFLQIVEFQLCAVGLRNSALVVQIVPINYWSFAADKVLIVDTGVTRS